jgi:hypothetical protein
MPSDGKYLSKMLWQIRFDSPILVALVEGEGEGENLSVLFHGRFKGFAYLIQNDYTKLYLFFSE